MTDSRILLSDVAQLKPVFTAHIGLSDDGDGALVLEGDPVRLPGPAETYKTTVAGKEISIRVAARFSTSDSVGPVQVVAVDCDRVIPEEDGDDEDELPGPEDQNDDSTGGYLGFKGVFGGKGMLVRVNEGECVTVEGGRASVTSMEKLDSGFAWYGDINVLDAIASKLPPFDQSLSRATACHMWHLPVRYYLALWHPELHSLSVVLVQMPFTVLAVMAGVNQ